MPYKEDGSRKSTSFYKMGRKHSEFPFKHVDMTKPADHAHDEAVADPDNIQLSGDLYETNVNGETRYKTTGEDNADIEMYAGSEEEKKELKARQMANIRK